MIRRLLFGLLVASLMTAPALAGYVSGGTFVVSTQVGTPVDNGGVICDGVNGDGIGGGCLLFPNSAQRSGFVGVLDAVAGANVAFQVCIDNDGDGICGGPQASGDCRDQIFFSHADGGVFHNPLGPLPTGFLDGCPGGFPGYVVLLCEGVHEEEAAVGGSAHTHALTQGTIFHAIKGTGYGDFCGGGFGSGGAGGFNEAAAKAYVVN